MKKLKNENLQRYYNMLREYNYERNGMFNSLQFLDIMKDLIGKEYYEDEGFVFNELGIRRKKVKWCLVL